VSDYLIPWGHIHQPKESEKGFSGMINKGKQILISNFRSLTIFSPPFEGGVATPWRGRGG